MTDATATVDEAMRWNAQILAQLLEAVEDYRDFVEGREGADGYTDEDRLFGLEVAHSAAAILRDVFLAGVEMHRSLPAALRPIRPMEILETVAESAMASLALGPEHELVLTPDEVDAMVREPFTEHWAQLVAGEAPDGVEDLQTARETLAARAASPDEVDEVAAALAGVRTTLAERYRACHDDRDTDAAARLAAEPATLMLAAKSDGRDVRSYPDETAFALSVVLPACFQSAVQIAGQEESAVRVLDPGEVEGLLDVRFERR